MPSETAEPKDEMAHPEKRDRILVAVCTYRRNAGLTTLLQALEVCADRVRDRAAVGVVIVDDTREGQARPVAEAFADRFELGITFLISGHQNISMARNKALEGALPGSDWIAMTDDDCEPAPEWLDAFLAVLEKTGADAVTGEMVRRVPPGSPRWLVEEPFLEVNIDRMDDCSEAPTAATNCSMIRSQWLREHPQIRFEPSLGVIGGEDMVFYRGARAEGLHIRFSAKGHVYENEPAERATLGYQLYRFYWEGNTSYVTSVRSGVPRWRMFIHGLASLARAVLRPLGRMMRGHNPQLRYCAASILGALGKLVGVIGIRVAHR